VVICPAIAIPYTRLLYTDNSGSLPHMYVCLRQTISLTLSHGSFLILVSMVTRQFADKPTRSQSNCRLVNSWTSQLAATFSVKFAVNNRYKCYLQHITLLNTQ